MESVMNLPPCSTLVCAALLLVSSMIVEWELGKIWLFWLTTSMLSRSVV